MMMYYTTRIQLSFEDDNGKTKRKTETYLVKAMSPTEVEIVISQKFENLAEITYEIKSIAQSRILDVYEYQNN
jgi:hypothetical protein